MIVYDKDIEKVVSCIQSFIMSIKSAGDSGRNKSLIVIYDYL